MAFWTAKKTTKGVESRDSRCQETTQTRKARWNATARSLDAWNYTANALHEVDVLWLRIFLCGLQLWVLPEHPRVQRGASQSHRRHADQDHHLWIQKILLDQGLQLQEDWLSEKILWMLQPGHRLQRVLQVYQLRKCLQLIYKYLFTL